MVKWKEERVISENIETVWRLFSDKNVKRLFAESGRTHSAGK
nr:hypothetical protein [Planococcus glaciei]